jgi:hypothetical protein
MSPEELKSQLCSAFCTAVTVRTVPTGYAISSGFEDNSGDRISFYLVPFDGGYQIEDDGSYLAHLIGRDIPIDHGTRGQLLQNILAQGGAYWDRDTFEIKTPAFEEAEVSKKVIDFLSSMIRVRDLELITREVIRSTFRDDAIAAIETRFSGSASFEQDVPVEKEFSEFPADLVIRPKGHATRAIPGAVYFVSTNDKLNEALLLQTEAQVLKRSNLGVIALIEEPEMKLISRKRFQRAQNRLLTMPIFRGDERAAMEVIARKLQLDQAA